MRKFNGPQRAIRPYRRKATRVPHQKRDSAPYFDFGGRYGGFINPITGTGTSIDKNSQSFYSATRLISKNQNETLYVESWAAAKFVNIPVDDMFVKWREFTGMDTAAVDLIRAAEEKFKIKSKLNKALKSGRLYGTGLFVILTKDSTPDKPLRVNRMMPGDLANIIAVDRFDATVVAKENNPSNPNYGLPTFYRITLKQGGAFVAHHSRVIRFDGLTPTSDNSWQAYDQDWGVSSLIPVITEIMQDSNVSKGAAHLVNEASVAIQKIDGFEDALSGGGGSASLQTRMEETTFLRSIFRTIFMDAEDDFGRHDVTFSGLPELMDRNAVRLAAAADIPETRFWSKSIIGMQSTGDGEQRNYALKVASDQANRLDEPMQKIDAVLSAHLGLSEPIDYKWVSIMDISEKDKTENALKKSQIVVPLVTAGIIDEDEARMVLDGDEIIGDLDDMGAPLPGDSPGLDDFKKRLANIQISRTQAEGR